MSLLYYSYSSFYCFSPLAYIIVYSSLFLTQLVSYNSTKEQLMFSFPTSSLMFSNFTNSWSVSTFHVSLTTLSQIFVGWRLSETCRAYLLSSENLVRKELALFTLFSACIAFSHDFWEWYVRFPVALTTVTLL